MKKTMNMLRKVSVFAVVIFAVTIITGITSIEAEAATAKPTKIALESSVSKKVIDVKGKTTISVSSVSPADADKAVTFKSSNTKIATVSAKGVVTGKKAGTVVITVTSKANKKVKATIKIKVKNMKPSSVTMPKNFSLGKGEKESLTVTVKPAGVYAPIKWSSSNTKVATVSSKGVVTAKADGKAIITAKLTQKNSSGKYLTSKTTVTVTTKVSSVVLSEENITIGVKGRTKALKATVKPSSVSNKKVEWISSDENIATVDSNGVVTATGYGETEITATASDGSGKKAVCKVSVVKPTAEKRDVYVSPEYIKSVMDGDQEESKDYVVLDTSTAVDTYNEGHIPGSYHCSVRLIETSTYAAYANNTIDYTDENLGNLLAPEELAKVLAKYGITKDTTVILYGVHPATDRVAFCFLYCGVENVKVLNGSLANWKKAGFEVETTTNEPPTKDNYEFGSEIPAHPEYIMSKDDLKKNLAENKNFRLVSIRSLDEFKGLSDGNYPMLQEKGEIAGAVFGRAGNDANTMEEYMNEDGTIISYETFKGFMEESYVYSTNEVCFFCGTGWRATMPLLLAYEKGWDVSLYDGGWWQWTRDLEHNEIQMLTPEQARTCSRFAYNTTEVTLKVGDTFKNDDIDIFPASGTLPTVRFKSDNTNVMTVDENGNVTAVGEGTATIKMIATDFSGRNTYYTVTVEAAEAPEETDETETPEAGETTEEQKAAEE
ncbi:MAG: Ig-like domain-containing protein [Lachnospiraceae bacterium]